MTESEPKKEERDDDYISEGSQDPEEIMKVIEGWRDERANRKVIKRSIGNELKRVISAEHTPELCKDKRVDSHSRSYVGFPQINLDDNTMNNVRGLTPKVNFNMTSPAFGIQKSPTMKQ